MAAACGTGGSRTALRAALSWRPGLALVVTSGPSAAQREAADKGEPGAERSGVKPVPIPVAFNPTQPGLRECLPQPRPEDQHRVLSEGWADVKVLGAGPSPATRLATMHPDDKVAVTGMVK